MKRKGFTLVELLAVIVIIAIIALIATPIILNVIDDAKKESVARGAEGYLDAVEKSILNDNLNEKELKDGTYYVGAKGVLYSDTNLKTEALKVSVKGELPITGSDITINKGKVTDCYLTISGYPVTCSEKGKVTVGNKGEISVRSVSISESNISIDEAETKQLTVTVLPESATDKKVTWSSSNESVVTVDSNGLITSKGNGKAVITATTSNGKTATVNIEVVIKLCKNTGTTGFALGTAYSCDPGDGTRKTFYVLEEGTDTVSLIMDSNLSNTTTWGSGFGGTSDTPSIARASLETQTAGWTKVISVDLPTYNQLYKAGGNKTTYMSSWLCSNLNGSNIYYWTSDPRNFKESAAAYIIKYSSSHCQLDTTSISSTNVRVRPVITVSKEDIH